ncbi:chitobiase/beta-hexosaminidase C-terminal domain-containing protein [Acetobacterium sp.]|uniref:chitobiase/beta-hexosaminidase C-terminal domain-containing protein n=1 Tax=Acetobacterium sp. TaxID=1872094 RepID=UPI0027290A87|nr:chitobiase/beta-hexosaminidase C-terminal domain-containing protein [Acetobacterium sp.]MDO9491007.1 chitobiase/beta-hexosaminidase C-terminal domain-containing protein [Acetobacterium sp.]
MNSKSRRKKREINGKTEVPIAGNNDAVVPDENKIAAETVNEQLEDEKTEALVEAADNDLNEDLKIATAAEQTEAQVANETEAVAAPVNEELDEQTAALVAAEEITAAAEVIDDEEKTEALMMEETEALINEETEALMLEETEALMDEKTEALVEVMTEPYVIENTESLIFKQHKPFKHKKPVIIASSIILGFLLIGGGVAGYLNYQRSTEISTDLKNGETLLTEAKFDEAMKAFEAVGTLDSDNADAIFGRAKAYAGLGDFGNARTYFEDTLKRITNLEKMKQVYNAYIDSEVNAKIGEEALFALMDRAAKDTGDEGYIKRKGEFMVKAPSFNLNPGSYQGTQAVDIIKGDPADKIYFTTDGSQPTTASPEYAAVIELAPGEKTIKAIEVGANGYPSKTIEGKYIISASSESLLENNISGSWTSRSGSYFYQYYFSNGYVTYSYNYGNGSSYSSTGNYQISGVNPNGTIGTLSVFNVSGYSLPSTLNINCEPLGDNMISINTRGYNYSP